MESNEFKYGDVESGTFGLSCGTEIHSLLPEICAGNTRA